MPAETRFHLDECVTVAVAQGLRRRGIDVTTTAEAGLISSDDLDQLAFAFRQGRALITQDADFLRIARAGRPHCGIAYYAPGSRTIGDLISGPEEMNGAIEFL